jgi:hypothetical protein
MYSSSGWPTDVRSSPNSGGKADIARARRRAIDGRDDIRKFGLTISNTKVTISQSVRFKQAARELGCDDSQERFVGP